jgi:hypothetical protein
MFLSTISGRDAGSLHRVHSLVRRELHLLAILVANKDTHITSRISHRERPRQKEFEGTIHVSVSQRSASKGHASALLLIAHCP